MKVGKSTIIWTVLALALLVGFFQTYSHFSGLTPQIGQYLSCSSPLSTNKDELKVYLTETAVAQSLLTTLCTNDVVARQFGDVQVVVGQNDYDTFRYINHGVADLALVKSNVIQAFGANMIYDYDEIAAHADYGAFFIALREKPALSKEYLLGKRIGILDYPSSRSGHIVPKMVLQTLGLNETNVNLNYFSSHGELRRALLAGEVDLISSYWSEEDEARLSKNYTVAVQKDVSGMRWYLKMQTQNTDLRCAMQQVIRTATATSSNSYYQQLALTQGCNDAG